MSDPYADIEATLAAHNALLRADWQSVADMARITRDEGLSWPQPLFAQDRNAPRCRLRRPARIKKRTVSPRPTMSVG